MTSAKSNYNIIVIRSVVPLQSMTDEGISYASDKRTRASEFSRRRVPPLPLSSFPSRHALFARFTPLSNRQSTRARAARVITEGGGRVYRLSFFHRYFQDRRRRLADPFLAVSLLVTVNELASRTANIARAPRADMPGGVFSRFRIIPYQAARTRTRDCIGHSFSELFLCVCVCAVV